METTEVIVLITIAAAILQIVLFFKVWAMTNDVRKLRDNYVLPSSENREFEIRKCIVFDDMERAKQIVIATFLEKISSGSPEPEEFVKLKNKLSEDLAKIGYSVPESIVKMNIHNDFSNLF